MNLSIYYRLQHQHDQAVIHGKQWLARLTAMKMRELLKQPEPKEMRPNGLLQ